MAFRDYNDDDAWVFERNLRPWCSPTRSDGSKKPQLSDTLIDLATITVGFACVIVLIDAAVSALN